MEEAAQQIELKTARHVIAQLRLQPTADCVLGSAPECDVEIQGAEVRPRHARLFMQRGALFAEPIDGAPLMVNGRPVQGAVGVGQGDWIALAGVLVQLSTDTVAPLAPAPESAERIEILVGRQGDCGLVIDSPQISRHHARVSIVDDQVWLEDLRSTNGTSVNGAPIRSPVTLTPGDRVAFASFVFVFTGAALEPAEIGNMVRVEVNALTKEVTDRTTGAPRRLLDEIDLVIDPGEFVVIFGTSGSGKSTLLDALNGRRPATSGQVAYNGVDLYGAFDQFRSGIGYVPQQDIVHRKIRVISALGYTARLRLPPDTSREEIATLSERVLERVGLSEKAQLAVDTPEPLSGGQLKRVSLAVELVANPNILFLDEATSGLDAGTDKKMMRLFARLAADGKTVVCVTHSLENIDCCNLVALLHRGCLVYYGPPGEAAAYFGVERLSDVYELLEQGEAEQWRARYRASPLYQTYITARRAATPAPIEAPQQAKSARAKRPGTSLRAGLRQMLTLTTRYADLLLSDRLNLLVLLLQAPLIALVVGAVFDIGGTLPERAAAEGQVTFVLVLSAIWFGCINSAREIVKELPVYLRERSVTVRIPAYLTSKLVPLALLCLLQCASFLAIVTLMLGFEGPFLERLATLFLAGLAATCMGLAVSALVNSNDKAIAALPLLLIPQFILSNSVVALSGVTEQVARFSVIAYWGLDAMRATLDETLRTPLPGSERALIEVQASWDDSMLALGGLALGFLVLTTLSLKLKDRRL
ncbi:FHA domain-containing protein [Marichromatium sp. AB31]|uniref:FHA domain-containing protein n=1 Tax=Marichromatium sp. AB31 TaxID=2483362 RepID=UPI000F3FF381|nr:FHA domain-containing protein [Marichromatium sp. AB31]RNE90766.1 ATP-binding cassette domain-containing protein [Marichromatium sp. AB31]